jgi:hypothetical protein
MSQLTQICDSAARVLSLPTPTGYVNNTGVNEKKLLVAFEQAGRERRRQKQWPQLIRTATLTLVDGVANPTMPGDLMAFINSTAWDVSASRPMEGPLTPQQWNNLKYGIVNVGPFKKFRVAGRLATKRFEIDPVPTASDAGETIKFTYLSGTVLLPPAWSTGASSTQLPYCSNSAGNIYSAYSTGTTGSTEPTHTSGTASDGAVTWSYYDNSYDIATSNTDTTLFDRECMEADVVWRFRKMSGMDYAEFKADADQMWEQYYTQIAGAPTLYLGGSFGNGPGLINMNNLPDTGYGS